MATSGKASNRKEEPIESDEYFDLVCVPCHNDGVNISVVGHCATCDEHLCYNCHSHHKKATLSKHHYVRGRGTMPTTQDLDASLQAVPIDNLATPCPRHNTEMIKLFCHDHSLLICSICVVLDHQKPCKVDYIPDISNTKINGPEVKDITNDMDKLLTKCTSIQSNTSKCDKSLIKALRDVMKYRQETNRRLDKLQKEVEGKIRTLQQRDEVDRKNVDTACEDVINKVKATYDGMKQLKASKQANGLFIAFINARTQLQDDENRIMSLSAGHAVEEYMFVPNQSIKDLLQNEETIGVVSRKRPPMKDSSPQFKQLSTLVDDKTSPSTTFVPLSTSADDTLNPVESNPSLMIASTNNQATQSKTLTIPRYDESSTKQADDVKTSDKTTTPQSKALTKSDHTTTEQAKGLNTSDKTTPQLSKAYTTVDRNTLQQSKQVTTDEKIAPQYSKSATTLDNTTQQQTKALGNEEKTSIGASETPRYDKSSTKQADDVTTSDKTTTPQSKALTKSDHTTTEQAKGLYTSDKTTPQLSTTYTSVDRNTLQQFKQVTTDEKIAPQYSKSTITLDNTTQQQTKALGNAEKTSKGAGEIYVKTSEDKVKCVIRGMTMVSPDKLVLADSDNNSIKLIDVKTKVITSQLSLGTTSGDKPHDITTTTTNSQVAVTVPNKQRLQFISVSDKLNKTHIIKTEGMCYGICCHQNKLIVTFCKPGKLEILSMRGTVITRVKTDSTGKDVFHWPVYAQANSRNIYVSDEGHEKVTMLNWQGKVTGRFRDMAYPRGLALLSDGSLLACDRGRDTVCKVSADCTNSTTVLQNQRCQLALCVDDEGHTMYISSCTLRGRQTDDNVILIHNIDA